MAKKAMVIGPIRGYIDKSTHEFDPEKRRLFESVIQELERHHYQVYSAHRTEDYGEHMRPSSECTPIDNRWNKEAGLVVAVLGKPSARSTHWELGWTTARGKNLILLLEKGHDYCTFIDGAAKAFGNVQYVWYDNYEDGLEGLRNRLGNLEQNEQKTRALWRRTTALATAASLTIALGVGHLTEGYRTDRRLQESRRAVLEDYARGLGSGGEFYGEHGTVISHGNNCVMYPTGWDPAQLRLYGIDNDVAQKKVLSELVNQKQS
ncbi:hypothetical protein HYW21_04675 [Candidatus Woesearchaeota archaeon]|nr:hypothetical protein [Candidatus Woesearchaeota archaeon]